MPVPACVRRGLPCRGSHLPPNGYLTWHPQRVCNPCLSCPALLNIQWLSTVPCHPLAYFLCYFTHCETSTNFVSWGKERACPALLTGTLCRILSGNSHSPRKSLALIPGISVKAQFWEKTVMLLRSFRLGFCHSPAAVHQLHSNKNPPETLAGGGGGTPVTRGSCRNCPGYARNESNIYASNHTGSRKSR